jgi:putative ABC transport system permease protein
MRLNLLALTWRSIVSRGFSIALVVFTLSLSIALYFSVLGVQRTTREHFANALRGVDLVVAPRGNDVQIILYSFFNIGEPTGLMAWETVEKLAAYDGVARAIPISLGDSVGPYRVLGTVPEIFAAGEIGGGFEFASGAPFTTLFAVVVGAEVARDMSLQIGDPITVEHGMGGVTEDAHDDMPFHIVGILKPTGTPFDRMVMVSLTAVDAIHTGWSGGKNLISAEELEHGAHGAEPDPVSAVLVQVEGRRHLFAVQRAINDDVAMGLTAVLPGVALAKVWQFLGGAEQGFRIIAWLVIGVSLIALMAMTLTSLEGRRRELAILRSVGASPAHLVSMLLLEALLIASLAAALGLGLSVLGAYGSALYIGSRYGLADLSVAWLSWADLNFILYVLLAAIVATIWPSMQLYRRTVHDGITIKH